MPGKVKVKILSGRNLPVMDRSSDTTDAYVEIKLGNTTYKTDVCRKSLNPQWNSEWYRFEVDDSELQDEPLQIRLMDHDTYSANDAIGKVYLDLNPLLLPNAPAPVRSTWNADSVGNTSCCTTTGSFMSGWIPVYDTMHGIRGEVNVIVKVELFSDFNKFRQSSCGVQFFCSPVIPQGYHAQVIHGFVEELVVNDDPEYQWIDKIRTPRASNEARQTLFFKLSGEIQRKIGLKALDLGGNAVIGYSQNFDLEGESGIVARGVGTAVTLTKIQDSVSQLDSNIQNESPLVATGRKSMLCNSNVNSAATSVAPSKSRDKILCETRVIPGYGEGTVKGQTVVGNRFPGLGKNRTKPKARNVKVVHENFKVLHPYESRSSSVGRGIQRPEIKRGTSTQSLCANARGSDKCECGNHRGNKFVRGLKAIGFSQKNKLLRKIPAFRNKFNSDSSTFEGSESEVESLSDWSQKEGKDETADKMARDKFHRTYSDSSYYGLDRVLEVKESTLSPPGSPRPETEIRDKVFSTIYDREESLSSGDSSSSSESSSEDDSSSVSSTKETSPVLSSVRRVSWKRGNCNKVPPSKYRCSEKREKKEGNFISKREDAEGKTISNRIQNRKIADKLASLTEINRLADSYRSDIITNLDLACPKMRIPKYDGEVSARSLPPYAKSVTADKPQELHKSKSATALRCGCPPHESTLSSVPIAPDYKDHGPCLIPSSRNDADVTERIPGEPTNNSTIQPGQQNPVPGTKPVCQSPAKVSSVPCIHRRSSDSDLSITPKGNSLTGSDRSYGTRDNHCRQNSLLVRPSINQENLDMLEYPFLTMSKYPPGFIQNLGGTVSARSVKLLERITNLEEPETRDAWWTELRMEVRSHARAMGCNVVIGYSENTSICDDVCVLSASGTAALINLNASASDSEIILPVGHVSNRANAQMHHQGKETMTNSLERCDLERENKTTGKTADKSGDAPVVGSVSMVPRPRHIADGSQDVEVSACTVCHIPYNESSVPFRVNMQKCAVCRRGKVPDVLFTTIDLIDNVPTVGKGCFIHAYVCRSKRDCKGEMNAKEISDGLPFLEYELHRLLINKLKVRGMNTIFGLKIQVSIGEKILIGLATGTAVFLTALPAPPVPKISAGNSWKDGKKLSEMQKQLQETVKKSKDIYQIKPISESDGHLNGRRPSEDTDESDDEFADLDLSQGNKDTCILEVDDAEDADIVSLLIDPTPIDGFHVVSTETVHGLEDLEIVKNLQMFTQVWRAKIPLGQPMSAFNQHFNRLLQSVYFKLRHMVPCALSDLQFKVILEQDEIQLSLLGMALGLGESDSKKKRIKNRLTSNFGREGDKKLDDSDLIFSLDEDSVGQIKPKSRSPVRSKTSLKHTPPRSRYGVDITPLSYVPGGKIERYLGNLNFFFIRESTCIREGGGLGGFIHSFITEVLAIVRAHVSALGGNAMVAYFMSECFLYHYPHKNQGQCLINVGGDVVYISYFPDD